MLQSLLASHTANPSPRHSSGLYANDKSDLLLLPPSQYRTNEIYEQLRDPIAKPHLCYLLFY